MIIVLFMMSLIIVAFFPVSAYAYLDAGSASMVLQMILAALVGAIVCIKIYWGKVCQMMRKLFHPSKPDDDA